MNQEQKSKFSPPLSLPSPTSADMSAHSSLHDGCEVFCLLRVAVLAVCGDCAKKAPSVCPPSSSFL